jgi:hypothetical protein
MPQVWPRKLKLFPRRVLMNGSPQCPAKAQTTAVCSTIRLREASQLNRLCERGHVRAAIKLLGFADVEILEFRWGPDWVVWDADRTTHQHGLHVEFTLRQDMPDTATRVRIDITAEPEAVIPNFLIKKTGRTVLDEATVGLRNKVLSTPPTSP